jgi:Fic family protein
MVSRDRYRPDPSAPPDELSPPEAHTAVPPEDVVLLDPADAALSRFRAGSVARAVGRYAHRRADVAFSSAYLEGNTFTLPEVYTLLDGVVPDGKSRDDVLQVLDLADASRTLLSHVEAGQFSLRPETADELNGIIAAHEALDAGIRRIHSSINSDGRGATVNVQGEMFVGLDKTNLARAEVVMAERIGAIDHPVLRAAGYAAFATYLQMYMDGNKRTARYMMDGELMAHGFDAVAIPAARRTEYQDALARMFRTGDTSPYALFLLDVADRGDPVA